MNLPILILCAGGHARVLLDALLSRQERVIGLLDERPELKGKVFLETPVLGDDAEVTIKHAPDSVLLVNGLGSVQGVEKRTDLYRRFKKQGYRFASVVHPSAVLARDVLIGEGSQVMAGAVVQTGSRLGENVIVNTGAVVDHDCHIGAHCHLAPGATLSGGVELGEGVHLGTGASVIQGVRIGRGALIAAGAVVVEDVPEGAKAMGVPARWTRRGAEL